MSVKKDIKFRVYVSFTAILVLAMAIIIKVIWIQQKDGDQLRAMAQKAHIRNEILPAERGNIYSEDGTLLCSTIPEFDLHVDFSVIKRDTFNRYVDTLSGCLARLFKDQPAATYKKALIRGYEHQLRYWPLRNRTPYYEYEAIRQFPIFKKSPNRGGLIVESKSKRQNPYGLLAYRAIGLWRENAPGVGLELQYNDVLSGDPGVRVIRKTTGNVWMPVEGSEVDPVNGKDIVTTIDVDVQDVAEHALQDVLQKYDCEYGTAIVMEVKTGKIRAMANLKRQQDGSYHEDFNYALVPTEPGSTFKLYSLLSMLEDGYVNLNTTVSTGNGTARFGKQTVRDDHAGLGTITVADAFAHSSNVAFAKLTDKFYHDNPMKFIHHLQALRLNVKTGVDLPGERSPLIKTTKSKSWNKITSIPYIGYGYESLISPLQTCMVYNAVANDGKMMKPYLVSRIQEYGQPEKVFEPTVLVKSIAKPSTIAALKEALHDVVEKGTAKGIQSPYYNFGGKTGTAQVADKGISYKDGVRQGSFVGFFPLENPQYTICVVARSKPHGVYYGAALGAPVFQAIADRLYATKIGGWQLPDSMVAKDGFLHQKGLNESFEPLGKVLGWRVSFPLNQQKMVALQATQKGQIEKQPGNALIRGVIPDVTGLGLKDALAILEDKGLRVNIIGDGRVVNQSLPAGTRIKKGEVINLTLG